MKRIVFGLGFMALAGALSTNAFADTSQTNRTEITEMASKQSELAYIVTFHKPVEGAACGPRSLHCKWIRWQEGKWENFWQCADQNLNSCPLR